MTIEKITNYFKDCIQAYGGGTIIHNGIYESKVFILLDADLIDAETGKILPPVVIEYPYPLPDFAQKNSTFMKALLHSVISTAPLGNVLDSEYIRTLIVEELVP